MENSSFSIEDLLQVKNIIEVATQRGAFRANELTTVGATYDKLKIFLDTVVTQAENAIKGEGETND